jgi:Copper transport outer membrane protein, MctB
VIDFRYHLVSIIAVFLALAVGLLIGSTFISGYAQEALTHEQHTLSQKNGSLSAQKAALTHQVIADQAFAQANAARLLDGTLAGQKVVLIEAPGATGAAGVIAALGQAGATVTGEVALQAPFFDDSAPTESSLTQLAQQFAPQADVRLSGGNVLYPSVQGQQEAAAVIAPAILSRASGVGLSSSVSQAILAGFIHGGYLTTSVSALPLANLAVILTPDTTPPQQAVSQTLVAVAAELKPAANGTVMAGGVSGIATGSAIDVENGGMTASTVDNADTESGQIIVAQALALLLHGKAPQAWGIGPAAAPSPPTPTSTPSISSSKSGGNGK